MIRLNFDPDCVTQAHITWQLNLQRPLLVSILHSALLQYFACAKNPSVCKGLCHPLLNRWITLSRI